MGTRIHYAFCINVNSLRLLGAHECAVSAQQMQWLRGCRWTWTCFTCRMDFFPEFTFLFCIRFVHAEWHRREISRKPWTKCVASFSSFSISVHSGRPFRHFHIIFFFCEWIENPKRQTKNTENNCETFSRDHFAESKHVQLSPSGAGSDCVWCFSIFSQHDGGNPRFHLPPTQYLFDVLL